MAKTYNVFPATDEQKATGKKASTDPNSHPIYILLDQTVDEIPGISDCRDSNGHAAKAFCSCCRKVFDIDVDLKELRKDDNGRVIKTTMETNSLLSTDPDRKNKSLGSIVCPDENCSSNEAIREFAENAEGKEFSHSNATAPLILVAKTPANPERTAGCWNIPEYEIASRLTLVMGDDGKTPTNIMTDIYNNQTTVYTSGKIFTKMHQITEDMNLTQHETFIKSDVKVSERNADGAVAYKSVLSKPEIIKAYDCFVPHEKKNSRGMPIEEDDFAMHPLWDEASTPDPHAKTNMRNPVMHDIAPRSYYIRHLDKNNNGDTIVRTRSQDIFGLHKPAGNPEMSVESEQYIAQFKNAKRNLIDKVLEATLPTDTINADNRHVYVNSKINGMYLAEHHPNHKDSDDISPDELSKAKMAQYETMITKYPAAFELACIQADDAILDHVCSKYRRSINDPAANVPEEEKKNGVKNLPDTVKAKIFREKVEAMSLMLTNVDDAVRHAVHDSKSADDLRKRMQFFAFGPATKDSPAALRDTIIPDEMFSRIIESKGKRAVEKAVAEAKEKGETLSKTKRDEIRENAKADAYVSIVTRGVEPDPNDKAHEAANELYKNDGESKKGGKKESKEERLTNAPSIASAKSLRARFKKDPIGIANTFYTMYKLTNADTRITAETALDVLDTIDQRTKKSAIHTSPAVHHRETLSFMKNYVKARGQAAMTDFYSKECPPPKLFNDTVKMYTGVKKDIVLMSNDAAGDYHITIKNNLRNYIANHSDKMHALQAAYGDFALYIKDHKLLEGKTSPSGIKRYIDNLAGEIIYDDTMTKMTEFRKEHSAEETAAEFADAVKLYKFDPANIDTSLDEFKAKTEEESKAKAFISDDKPLFDVSLKDMHKTLVECTGNKQSIPSNVPLHYTDQEREMFNQTYPNPNGEGIWQFKLLENSTEYIRTAAALHNCVARKDTGYFAKAERKDAYIVNFTDEVGKIQGCIEIKDHGSRLSCAQFFSHHNMHLPTRFAKVAEQWLDERNISHNGIYFNGDDERVREMEQDDHGGWDVAAIDDVTGRQVSKASKKTDAELRQEYAKSIFPKGLPEPSPALNDALLKTIVPDFYEAIKIEDAKKHGDAPANPAAAALATELNNNDQHGGNDTPNDDTPNVR